MHISRVQIKNFRNFSNLDIPLNGNVVMIGENRIGKSNFILALRLVLDASVPDSVRQLKLTEIFDHCDRTQPPEVEIHLDFSNFQNDTNLTALLTDYRLATDYNIARLSYSYRKKADVVGSPKSEIDYEFKVYGGGDETRSVRSEVRRRICLDVLPALRDAETELGTWRSSPLRPLVEEAVTAVPQMDLDSISTDIVGITNRMTALPSIAAVENNLRTKMAELAGPKQDIKSKLGFVPTDPLRLFRSIRVFIDDGKRNISDASLGSANLALLTLKLAEFSWRREKNEINYTIACIEEPEAHLHPHLQRSVFRKLFTTTGQSNQSLILTTLSTNIVSVSPLHSIVLLRGRSEHGTLGYSLANLSLTPVETEDIQRYLDVSRAEILFSRGIIFVEGDAEAALMPVFAKCMGWDLDDLGISICNVGGVHFRPYVKLAQSLGIPFVVITDWDPMPVDPPLGRKRALDIIDDIKSVTGAPQFTAQERVLFSADDNSLKNVSQLWGIFLNNDTLETEVSRTPTIVQSLIEVLEAEEFGARRRARIAAWKANPATVNGEQLMSMIADIGKGRLAGRLALKAFNNTPNPTAMNHTVNAQQINQTTADLVNWIPPLYIQAALRYIVAKVE